MEEKLIHEAMLTLGRKDEVEALLEKLNKSVDKLDALSKVEGFTDMIDIVKKYINNEYQDIKPLAVEKMIAGLIYVVNGDDLIPDAITNYGMKDDEAFIKEVLEEVKEDINEYKNSH